MELALTTSTRGPVTILALAGDVDLDTAPVLRSRLQELQGAGASVVLDLTEVEFMDSSALGAIVTAQRDLTDAGGSLAVACPRPHVQKVFSITRLSEVVPVFDTVDAACG